MEDSLFINLFDLTHQPLIIEVNHILAVKARSPKGSIIYFKKCKGGKRLELEAEQTPAEIRKHIESVRERFKRTQKL